MWGCLYMVLSHSTLLLPLPHSCSVEVMACLSTRGKQMVNNSPGEMSLTGKQRQTKSSPIQGLGEGTMGQMQGEPVLIHSAAGWEPTGRHAWHFTSTTRGEPRHNEAKREICRQMIKIIREPINGGVIPKPLCRLSVLLEHLFDTLALWSLSLSLFGEAHPFFLQCAGYSHFRCFALR